jgi:EmrB/QacA subfamily drug resistance transporter
VAAAERAIRGRHDEAPAHVGVIFAGLMLALLLAALDGTIVATALPTIVADLGGLDRLSWLTSAFLLAQTVVTPVYGKLGDLLGRKSVLQAAVIIFLIGSVLCGAASSMTLLIVFRAVQGLGAGGLVVVAQAVIGDIVPPRDRGRYQGIFGGVFGVASVAGPLIGGLIVEHVSWRWIFYVNLPVGLIALAVIGSTLPGRVTRGRPVIDYAGAALLAAGLSATVLVTSLGGTTWSWGSPQVITTLVLAGALLGVFLLVESRSVEPILPLSMLGDRVFRVAGTLSLIVGFALFGSVTFLPLLFQTVNGSGPIEAGLRLAPLMGGVLVASVVSGRLIAQLGRYKMFPVAGTAVMAVALALLSRIEVATSTTTISVYLVLLGAGLGMVMQVLVLAVQNAVSYSVLGAATSGVTLARGIGGSVGTAVFGSVFVSHLHDRLATTLGGSLAAQASSGGRLSGDQVAQLPAAARAAYEQAYVDSLTPVFLAAAIVAAGGFLLSLALPEIRLRAGPATSRGLGDALAAPKAADSLAEIDRELAMLVSSDARLRFNQRLAAEVGGDLSAGAVWALARADLFGFELTVSLARERGVDAERIATVIGELREGGFATDENGMVVLTEGGRAMSRRVVEARRVLLVELLEDESAERTPEVRLLLERLALQLAGQRP